MSYAMLKIFLPAVSFAIVLGFLTSGLGFPRLDDLGEELGTVS